MTDMQIVKVIVLGELPVACIQCSIYEPAHGMWGSCPVIPMRKLEYEEFQRMRPSDCPLALEDEKEKE